MHRTVCQRQLSFLLEQLCRKMFQSAYRDCVFIDLAAATGG